MNPVARYRESIADRTGVTGGSIAGSIGGARSASVPWSFHGMLGRSAAMTEVFRRLRRAAVADVPVLLTGERGTGKALAARAVHDESGRRHAPFVAVSCADLPPTQLEEELFGHARAGLFEAAHGGTLFLDDIGALGRTAQLGLVHTIASGESRRIGEAVGRGVDVRVIAATSEALEPLVAQSGFHDELLYRLRVVTVELPSLRERRDDLPLLVEHFLQLFATRYGLPVRTLAADAMAQLCAHDWPGNVRELRHVIEGALVVADGPSITARELPAAIATRAPVSTSPLTLAAAKELPFVEARALALREFDRAFLAAALARNGGNVARTARALGLHRQSLQKLLVRRALRPCGE